MSVMFGQGAIILLPYTIAGAFGGHGFVGVETRQRSLEQIAAVGTSVR